MVDSVVEVLVEDHHVTGHRLQRREGQVLTAHAVVVESAVLGFRDVEAVQRQKAAAEIGEVGSGNGSTVRSRYIRSTEVLFLILPAGSILDICRGYSPRCIGE